ncbi:MAG: fabH3 [Frankiales bacterium]|nr:fabH3 [Frankiales bacterium]
MNLHESHPGPPSRGVPRRVDRGARALSPRAAVLTGIGSWLPERVVTNDQLSQVLDTSDEWIRTRTGISQRFHAATGESTSDLAVEAGRRALKSAGDDHVDALILATTTPDYPCPATAPDIAARLGLSGIAAFDIAAVCTGFVYALSAAAGLIAAGTAERVMVIGADVYSTILNPVDRSTAVIFGDAAGAVVLRAGRPDELGALGPMVLGSDGENHRLIEIPGGGARQRSNGQPSEPDDEYFRMAGPEVFRHAIVRMSEAASRAMELARWLPGDVDRFAAHQANARILTSVLERVGLPATCQLSNVARVGNTSAASIPLLLDECAADGRLEAGQGVLLSAFGGGLTWGATTLRWPALTTVH